MIEHISFDPKLTQSNDLQLLRKSIGRFQRLFRAGDYGFWEWDVKTNTFIWAGGFWQCLGYDQSDAAVINSPEAVLERIYEPDRHLVKIIFEAHFKSFEPIYATYRIYDKYNKVVWTQIRADSVRDEIGRPEIITGMSFDISEFKAIEKALRESEARQARIVEASSDGIWEWYADHGGFHFSQRCWEILGYNAQDDLVTRGEDRLHIWRHHIFPEDRKKFDDALARHIRGEGIFDVEYRIVCKNGDIRWVRARGKAVFDSHGKPKIMSGSNIDITDIKRAEERVIKAKEQAEKANLAKSEFLSSMSHELRTPLNAILGYAQLFEMDQNLNALQVANLREIRKAGQHLLQLINDVLDLSKIESGGFSIEMEPVLASRVVLECCSLLETQASSFGIKLSVNFGLFDNVYVKADVKRLKQALINLISNGIKYNKLGGSVVVVFEGLGEHRLRILVQDTGRGIPADKRKHMFEPFNRLSAENSNIEGSGVGLVITKRLVEMMSGSIDYTSVENEGTVFWIELPTSCPEGLALPHLIKDEPQPASTELHLRLQQPLEVLYIEDNTTNIRLMRQIAERFEMINLDIADEPFTGVFKARQKQPDLIILDINLPGMDGFEVLSVLKADPRTQAIPVIALSANAMPHDIERGKEADFVDYLTKPIQLDQFVATLNELFSSNEFRL